MKRVFHIAMLAVAAGVVTAPAADAHIVAATNLDGRWQWVWTRAGLIHAGVPPGAAKLLAGPGMIEFKAGRVYKLDPRTGRVQFLAGSFTVAGMWPRSSSVASPACDLPRPASCPDSAISSGGASTATG